MRRAWFYVSLFILLAVGAVFAQDVVIPPVYTVIFSATILQAIGVIVGFTQMIKNLIKVTGWLAIALAFAVSLVYAFIMYMSNGLYFCVVAGLAAGLASALAYKGTKAAGKLV